MAKRGRPRKVPLESEVELEGQVAVLSPKEPVEDGIYSPDYSGRRWWLLGIKFDEERQQIPFHNKAFGGIPWQEGTQKQVRTEDGWLGLDGYRTRVTRQLLLSSQILKAVSEIKQKVVRWVPRRIETDGAVVDRWAANVLSLEHRIKAYDKKAESFVPTGHLYTAVPNDVPVATYLVFIPRAMLDEKGTRGNFYEPDLSSMDTMLDLDPSLVPDRMSGKHDPSQGGDEVW